MSSSRNMSNADVIFFLSTLKRLDHVSLALDLHLPQNVQSLFHSMTPEQKAEATGRLERMNLLLGFLSEQSLLTLLFSSSSKTECTTSRFSSEATALELGAAARTLCSSTTPSNPKASRDSDT